MQVPDVNVLLYATDATAPAHSPCHVWLKGALGGSEPVGFAWAVLLAFLRLSTKAQVFRNPLSVVEALGQVELWLSQPASVIVHPSERHVGVLRGLLKPLGTAGNLTSDAHLAAIAIEHGATLVSCDTDFARFQGLTWRNPGRPLR